MPITLLDHDVRRVCARLRERGGPDLAPYRTGTLGRRIALRMARFPGTDVERYLALLDRDAHERRALVSALMVRVSRFFRVARVFERLQHDILPAFGPRPLCAWSAGCGAGEEAYSVAWLFEDLAEDLAPVGPGTSTVLATDLDAAALEAARAARYPAAALEETSPERRRRFAAVEGPRATWYTPPDAVRARVAFARHDLLADGLPGGPFDLVFCRNVLIYVTREHALRAQRLLARALVPGGVLCLGESEWLAPELEAAFEVVDRGARLFRRTGRPLA